MMNRLVESQLPTKWGLFTIIAYEGGVEGMPHLALISGKLKKNAEGVLLRVHSECMTGDLFGSARCDCGEQLESAIALIQAQGGVLIYLRQEGRGIGLVNKLKAYNLQEKGLNTADANLHLGFEIDNRDYEIALDILSDLKIKSVNLLTNNPQKIEAFDGSNIQLLSRVPLIMDARKENEAYLKAKEELMGHLLKNL